MSDGWWGLGGVVVGAAIAGGKEVIFDLLNRHRNARYLAIRMVCLLDRYVDGCVEVVEDDGTVDGRPANPDGTHESQAEYPDFPIDGLDGDWKSMPAHLMYALLGFPNAIEAARHRISGEAEHAMPPDYEEVFEERRFQFAKLGLRVSDLADELRRRNKIPAREFDGWDPIDYLRTRLAAIEKSRKDKTAHRHLPFED